MKQTECGNAVNVKLYFSIHIHDEGSGKIWNTEPIDMVQAIPHRYILSFFFLWRFTRALWHSKLNKAFLVAQVTEKASLENGYRPCLHTTAVHTQNWTVQDQSGEIEITCQPCCLADNLQTVPAYCFLSFKGANMHRLTFRGQVYDYFLWISVVLS